MTTVVVLWALSAAPPDVPIAASSPWAMLSDQLARGDLAAARAYAETVASERALRGQPQSPLEVGLVLDMLPAVKPDRHQALLGVAEALSPGDVRIPAAHMLVSDATDALTDALPKTLRAFVADPVARNELESRVAMALLLALITTLVIVALGVALTRARLLAHDVGTWLPPRLRTGALPLAAAVTLIMLPGGLGLGLIGAALMGLVLHSFHLRLGERLVCLVLATLASFSGELVRRALTPMSVSDDASRCLAGGCDPAGEARLHLASRTDTDFARSRLALALLALRQDPPDLPMADVFLAAVPRGDPNRLVGETQLALHQLRDHCTMYGGKAPPDAPERLAALERELLVRPEAVTLLAASVTAGLRGQAELARAHRERAVVADPQRVSRFLSTLPSHRPGRADVEPATDLCAPLFRPQVEVPVFGLPAVTVPRTPPFWFRLSGADRPGLVRLLAWIAIAVLILPLFRRYRVAYACDVCGAPASVRRNPELQGLSECERCLFARVVVATPNRDASGASREEHRHSPLQLATLVVPGLGAILVGRLLTGGFGLLLFLIGVFLQPWSAGPSAIEDGASISVAAVLGRVGSWLSLSVWALLLALEVRRPPRPARSGSAERAS